MSALKDKYGPVALVTGASSGIGTAFAEELATRGMDLVLAARRLDRLEELKQRLEVDHDVKVRVIESDLSRADAPDALAAATADLDIGLLVSNAGFGSKGWFESIDRELMVDVLMVNCHAQMMLAHHFLPRLKARGKGGLLFVSSVEGLMGGPFSTVYAASKAFVVSLGEGLWGEAQGTGVDVLTVTPGATESEAAARQGMDVSKMQNVQSASECAALSLDHLSEGPTWCPHPHYRAMFEQMVAMPRKEALLGMAQAMKPKG